MAELPFSVDFIQSLVEGRSVFLTRLFQLASFMGEVEGYILIITGIYVMHDKALAFRLSVVVLLTMSFNHALKIIIQNPRPFISDGTWAQKWAVSAENARELATEYSTPSGHAMAGAAFYSQLYASVKNAGVRMIALLAILLTGLSRPYLGVHYLEDVLIGWLIGLSFVLLLMKHAGRLATLWNKRSYRQQVMLAVVSSVALWLVTVVTNGWSIDEQPLAFIGYAGFLTGIVIAHPMETKKVNFDPGGSPLSHKVFRYAISVGMVIATLLFLDELFEWLSDDSSLSGHILQYLRYTIAGTVAMFFAPLLFTRVGLAQTGIATSQ